MNANKTEPAIADPSSSTWKKVGQSATPAVICALTPIKPIERARSGSFRININSPSTTGRIEKPAAVSRDTLERRALRLSAHRAARKPFMATLLSGGGNALPDPLALQPAALEAPRH